MKVYQVLLDNCDDIYIYGDVFVSREMAERALKIEADRWDIDIEHCRIKEITVKTK